MIPHPVIIFLNPKMLHRGVLSCASYSSINRRRRCVLREASTYGMEVAYVIGFRFSSFLFWFFLGLPWFSSSSSFSGIFMRGRC